MSHTSFGKSMSPPFGWAILAKTSQALWKRLKDQETTQKWGSKITKCQKWTDVINTTTTAAAVAVAAAATAAPAATATTAATAATTTTITNNNG